MKSKERPILFSAPMVRALLAGTKTQTRRIAKPSRKYPFEFIGSGTKADPDWNDPSCWGFLSEDGDAWLLKDGTKEPDIHQIPCPYGQPGDQLWVRETHFNWWSIDKGNPAGPRVFSHVAAFAADGYELEHGEKWIPSIHMLRAASRILLEIVSVRVERLQDISEEGAIAEGIEIVSLKGLRTGVPLYRNYGCPQIPDRSARYSFQTLWGSINGTGSWEVNPWVWVIEFKRIDNERATD